MPAETYEFFSIAIKKGVFDDKYVKKGSEQLIAATETFVLSGALSKKEQKDLIKELSFLSRRRQLKT
jgi:hypothetical protein